jgi:hypothetical protein
MLLSLSATSSDAPALASLWERPVLETEADYGVLVPAIVTRLTSPGRKVIAATLAETGTDPTEAIAAGAELGRALIQLATAGDVFVLFSANTAASLSPRAPLTERPAGRELDNAIRNCLSSDVGDLSSIPVSLWIEAGCCAAGCFTAIATCFTGYQATTLSYEFPYGVGYLVASVDS